ncbi:hypothetical protein NYR77_01510 [Actinobacillus equuli subsp. haemolyticus]|nr:hypothetical protein [Actinobacillus equuli]WGE67734.1 hypothetical protein NYR77_01510 [Actinobacillus equuli subsp. haemolyticus]WGE82651.1 hypothetical protein NYR86_06320 [Actinobacillus equuli subsp. equuli]
MNNFYFSGFVINENQREQIYKNISSISDMENFIKFFMSHSNGVMILSDESKEDDDNFSELYLYKDGEFYMPVLHINVSDDLEVKNIKGEGDGWCLFQGEPYPNNMITKDIEIVFSVFREFYLTGKVESMV